LLLTSRGFTGKIILENNNTCYGGKAVFGEHGFSSRTVGSKVFSWEKNNNMREKNMCFFGFSSRGKIHLFFKIALLIRKCHTTTTTTTIATPDFKNVSICHPLLDPPS